MSGSWASDWALNDIVTVSEFRKGTGCVADSTLSVPAASFDFSGLPTTYAHMRIVVDGRSDVAATAASVLLRLNNDSAANYDYQYGQDQAATHTAVEAFGQTSILIGSMAGATAIASVSGSTVIDIPNYGAATFNKTIHSRSAVKIGTATTNISAYMVNGFWRSSVAVSRITLTPSSGNWIAGSRCSIYVMGS